MTSRVEVFAHCSDNKEVVVIQTDNVDPNFNERTLIQNGENKSFYIYDDRVVTAQEVLKV